MSFAYIDSHGNEVAIPSVDALALRIELGAIKADTQLMIGDARKLADGGAPAARGYPTSEALHRRGRCRT